MTNLEWSHLTVEAEKALELAGEEARRLACEEAGPEHLLLGLLRVGHGAAAEVLQTVGVTLGACRLQVERLSSPAAPDAGASSRSYNAVLFAALAEALQAGHRIVGTGHLLLALASAQSSIISSILDEQGIAITEMRSLILHTMDRSVEYRAPSLPTPARLAILRQAERIQGLRRYVENLGGPWVAYFEPLIDDINLRLRVALHEFMVNVMDGATDNVGPTENLALAETHFIESVDMALEDAMRKLHEHGLGTDIASEDPPRPS